MTEDRLKGMLDAAEEIAPLEERDERADAGGDAPPPDAEEPERNRLPDDSPVIPLGKMGEVCAYLDELGQYAEMKVRDHTRLNIEGLFGRQADVYLPLNWPRYTKAGKNPETGEDLYVISGWRPELAATALLTAAADKGVWSPHDRVRGAGAWRGPEGELVLHLGDRLFVVKPQSDARGQGGLPWEEQKPGLVGFMVYPTAAATHLPSIAPAPAAPADKNPGLRLLRLLRTWNWRRKDVDPELLLGFVCAAMLAGALKVRPVAWLTGGYGTGKSSLQEAIKWLFGAGGLLHAVDPSAPSIRQILQHSALPIAIDEAESTEDNTRMNALVLLARAAATGALVPRGGSDHKAVTFTLRSCFLMASILIPPLLPQDKSRMAILDLLRLPQGATPPKITERGMGKIGAQLLQRLITNWHRAEATIELYREAMRKLGLDSRGQDVYGTLFACQDLALYDELPETDMLQGLQERVKPWILADQETNDGDSLSCWNHLLTYSIDSGGDSRRREPIGWWICRASGYQLPDQEKPDDVQMKAAQRVLGQFGIAVLPMKDFPYITETGEEAKRSLWFYVAIANKHTGLLRVFNGTQWGGRPGADGVWAQSLRRLTEHPKQINRVQWIGGATCRATFLPIELAWPKKETASAPAEEGPGAAERQQQDAPERPGADTVFISSPSNEVEKTDMGAAQPSVLDDEEDDL